MNSELIGSGMGQWVWDTMFSMTLLMAAVLLLRKPVSHYFGAKIAYLLWALPLARLFMPSLTLKIAAPVEPVETLAAPIGGADLAFMVPVEQAVSGAFSSIDWMMIAIIIWLGGAGMLFISKLASYFQFREDIVSDGRLVGRHDNIKILETAAVGGPLAFGFFQKYIAVPTNFFRNYAPRERELALEHEIAHHESGDLAANFIGLLILSLHWFNPVAWFAWIAFRQDQETACDARILQQGGQEVRAIYGRTIAKSVSGHRLGLASPLNQKNKIKDRIKMLGQSEKSKLRKRLGALMVGASAIVALPLTATVTYVEEAESHPSDAQHGVQGQSARATVEIGDDGVFVTEKTDDGYKYTVSNKHGTYELRSDRKLKKSEIDVKLSRMVPSYKKMSLQEVPAVPALPEAVLGGDDHKTVNITMTNGSKDFGSDKQYVHRIKHDGRTIILRTNRKLSNEDVRGMVEEAEESRKEADRELREHRHEREETRREEREHRHEMREIERVVEREVERALNREMKEVQREVEQEARKANREARKAQHKARSSSQNITWNSKSRSRSSSSKRSWNSNYAIAPVVPTSPVPPKFDFISTNFMSGVISTQTASVRSTKCKKMGRGVAFSSQRGVMTEQTWANITGCMGVSVDWRDKRFLKLTLETLKSARSDLSNSCSKPNAKHKRKIKVFDREIRHLQHKLTTV